MPCFSQTAYSTSAYIDFSLSSVDARVSCIDLARMFVTAVFIGEVFQGWLYVKLEARNLPELIRFAPGICMFTVVERYYACRGAKLPLCQN